MRIEVLPVEIALPKQAAYRVSQLPIPDSVGAFVYADVDARPLLGQLQGGGVEAGAGGRRAKNEIAFRELRVPFDQRAVLFRNRREPANRVRSRIIPHPSSTIHFPCLPKHSAICYTDETV